MKQLFFGLLLSLTFGTYAQNSPKEVLFTIDNKPYHTDEFARVYKKNLDLVKDESQKDLNLYLDLFIGYKLKINKAYKLGLQNGEQYKTELKSYRNQLSKNYTNDSKVTNELVQEAYDRSLKEIEAAHILIMVDENATPADTLKAYKKALDIRQKAVGGQDFGALASQYSEDPSAKENKGDLGFFSSFRMVYAFESAAYKTPKGEISKPIRTRFGYHIIKVNDVRDNRGELTVAHIMILNPAAKEDLGAQEKAKQTIQDIYKKIQQGENFESLAKQFSEDKSSSSRGGLLSQFGSGQLSSQEFETVAFNMKNANDVSEPFQSQFGWHIVKLIAKHPIKSFDDLKSELESKVGKDDRSRLITQSLNDKLRKKYTVKSNAKVVTATKKAITDKLYANTWEVPANRAPYDGTLFTIESNNVSGTDFLNYVKGQQKAGLTIKPLSNLIENLYVRFIDQKLNDYYDANLENEFPEFSLVMDEYRDGLLLFDLMEKEIWEKSKTDTLGLTSYYEANKSKYAWKNRMDIVVLSSTKQDVIKQARKLLKKGETPEAIKEKLNVKEVVNVMSNVGVFEEGTDAIPKGLPMKEGISDIIKDGDYYFVAKVNKVMPAGSKSLDEARGKVVNDYQQYLEENWVKDLKKEFTVEVNQPIFEKVKMQLKP